MSMAVRERRTEIGVLKTLGSSSAHVMGFVVGEALLLGILGGAVGVFGSQGLLYFVSHAPGVSEILAGIGLSGGELKPAVAALGFFIAVVLGLFAGLVPALSAYRAKIAGLRSWVSMGVMPRMNWRQVKAFGEESDRLIAPRPKTARKFAAKPGGLHPKARTRAAALRS
jgi:hypothetical protein